MNYYKKAFIYRLENTGLQIVLAFATESNITNHFFTVILNFEFQSLNALGVKWAHLFTRGMFFLSPYLTDVALDIKSRPSTVSVCVRACVRACVCVCVCETK